MIDLTVRGVLYLLVFLASLALSGVTNDLPTWIPTTILIFTVFLITFGYPVLFETFWDGKTPGKAALGLRVVTVEGAPIRFRHAMIRGSLLVFELGIGSGMIAASSIFVTEKNQRLGDMAAGTLVLRERTASKVPVATAFIPPPGTEEFASTLDVSSLTTDDYLTIRAFLTRSSSLAPKPRQDIAEQVGRQIAQKVRAQPPPWMTAEVFLICIAAAYQRRFSA